MYWNRLFGLLVCATLFHTPALTASEADDKKQTQAQTQQQTQSGAQEAQGNYYAQLRPRMRGANEPDKLWDIAIENDDLFTFCYRNAEHVRLWRAEPKFPQTIHLKNRDQQQQVDLEWPFNIQEMAWPQAELTLLDNKMYVIEFIDAKQQQTTRVLRFHAVPENFEQQALAEQLAYLRAQSCLVQAQWLETRR